uniref:DNA-directed RNA polymerase subunit n=1 Tax=Phascolarctos cinereus TaxID=38626 RepID=A0A6P5JZV2_PHACI|nr:DNA-directed RNA polymerase III subunit RPC8 isoform X1 [Phascolarctos cinereus]XP_020838370.1 DNA-directed RNA polymerase III subunit RPC8 isoform X1 [Phascolarctos cinereus]
MFVLVEMVDTVRIPPWQFERKLNDSIAEELNKKLANKVVYNVGLCICLYDITKLEDAYVFPGDGASHTKEFLDSPTPWTSALGFASPSAAARGQVAGAGLEVGRLVFSLPSKFPGLGGWKIFPSFHFRYVVFHPFLDEILIGVIKGCSPDGVHVSLGFFDDILIPPESLQQPAKLSVMRPSRCGFGNMRQKKEPTTYTWTPGRRSASEWWMRALLTRPRQDPVLRRLRHPVKRLPKRRPLTPLWDPSVNQAWGFSLGGLAVRDGQRTFPVPAA